MDTSGCGMHTAADQRLAAALEAEGLARDRIQVSPLLGDASAREYFRLSGEGLRPTIEPEWTAIGMVMPMDPPPPPDRALPFLDVLSYLKRCGLAMPTIYFYRPEHGVLLMQDLQDATFERWLGRLSPEEQESAYREAIDILVEMQARSLLAPEPRCVAFRRAFDAERYLWEMRRFRRYALEWAERYPLQAEAREQVEDAFRRLARRLLDQPLVFCHRDYHSRNLMVHLRRLYMIDFQDARLGVQTYDLASLLRDSYQVLPQAVMEGLLEYYLTHPGRNLLPSTSDLRSLFYWTAVQRNLHAAACFVVFHLDRHNPRYLCYLQPTLDYLLSNLERFPELDGLRQVVEARRPQLLGWIAEGASSSPDPPPDDRRG